MNQQTMNQVMQPTENILQNWQRDQNKALQSWLTGASDAEAGRKAGDPLNVTNWASWFLMQQAQPKQLQAGLELSGRYMGAGAPMGLTGDLAARQLSINDEVQSINRGIMNDYRNNTALYGGLAGRDVGRIIAEAARTGATGTGMDQGVINQVIRDNANAAAVSQRFFGGTVLQRLDQMNALLGVNATATIGGPGITAGLREWSAAGLMTGYTPAEMRLFGEASAQVYRHFGASSLGAMSTGNIAAYLTSTGMTSGSSAFVNERSFREGVISRTAGAEASPLARLIAGAQVLVGEAGANVGGFQDALKGGGYLSPGGVLDIAQRFGYKGGLGDIRSAGYTREADVIRAKGGATLPVLMSNLEQIESVQRGQVMSVLMNRGMTEAQARGAIGQVKGAFTLANIGKYMIPGMAGGKAILGDITNLFNQAAPTLGFGTAEELDKLKTAAKAERFYLSLGRGADAVSIDELTAGRGSMRGLLGIQNMLAVKGGSASKLKSLYGALTGGMDIASRAELTGSMKALGDIEDSQLEAKATTGYDVVAMAVQTGMYKGGLLTPEARKPLEDLMLRRGQHKGGGDSWAKALAEYATPEETRKWMVNVNIRDIMATDKGKKLNADEVRNEATAIAQLQIYQSIPGKESAMTAAAIKKLAAGAELSEVMGGLEKTDPKGFEKWRAGLREAMRSNEKLGVSAVD